MASESSQEAFWEAATRTEITFNEHLQQAKSCGVQGVLAPQEDKIQRDQSMNEVAQGVWAASTLVLICVYLMESLRHVNVSPYALNCILIQKNIEWVSEVSSLHDNDIMRETNLDVQGVLASSTDL